MKLASEILRRRKDNRLIVGLVLAVLVVWSGVSVLEQRAAEMDPATITRGLLLFVLSYINVTLIAAVLFVLGRTLLKLWLDRRRPALGSRFQTKLLVTYIGLTAIPVALVFFTANSLLQSSVDRWFSTPVRRVVQQARAVQDRSERRILERALDEARLVAARPAGSGDDPASLDALRRNRGLDALEIYRRTERVAVAAAEPVPPPLSAETLGGEGADGEPFKIEVLPDGSHRYRAAFRSGDRVYAAGIRLPAVEARALDGIAAAWSDYQKLEVQKPAIKAANISTFLLITLAILFASIWTGLTLARRITEPIGALAASTGRLRSGDYSARVDVPATDELAVLVESFNRMAAGLEETRAALLRSNEDLQTSNRRLDVERRLFSTVLESVTTGVVAFDADGQITVCNPAARMLLGLDVEVTAASLAARRDLAPLLELLAEVRAGAPAVGPREIVLPGESGDRHLEASVRPLPPAPGEARGGRVLAIEDTTLVAREQKLAAWNEVARRVAHEIKNPLTPIRLSAERILRRFRSSAPDLPDVIEGGTRIIVEEVGFLKSLVNEFSRFARLPEMRPAPTDLPELARATVRLFEGARPGVAVRVESRLRNDLVRLDPDQMKRVLVNLIDNALEACGESGEILVLLSDRDGACTIEVADTGRGVPARDRDKLFLPDFTTKGRGTGLGLAIVYRIVADHRGTIRVEDNRPRGARFIIELPAA